jgi:putative spermidine/putrescine transport system ATP-binding protein
MTAPAGLPLRLDALSKRFGEFVAVDRVSLEIAGGEFVTLLGPSGSGKTTTLMMIAGFTEPSAGRIWLGDRPVDALPSYRRGFGMVFQNYALFPHMTAADNIGFPLKMRGVSGSERARRVNTALELVRLPGFGDRYPNQLSGGQQQRIALARALVYNPPVLLMDEPLGALDKKLRDEMQLEIKRIQEQIGITAIYVTHDQEEALVMSDRIAVMNGGRIEQIDVPGRLYERPATRFVADFIGESNIIPLAGPPDADGRARARFGPVMIVRSDPGNGHRATSELVVRPEKLRFRADDPALDNVLSGPITEVVYAGDATKYRVRVADDLVLTVKRQNRAGQADYQAGDPVEIGWRADDGSTV